MSASDSKVVKVHDIRKTIIGGRMVRFRVDSFATTSYGNRQVWMTNLETNKSEFNWLSAVETYYPLVKRGLKDHLRSQIKQAKKNIRRWTKELKMVKE